MNYMQKQNPKVYGARAASAKLTGPCAIRRPGIEPGLKAWEASVKPLDQRRKYKKSIKEIIKSFRQQIVQLLLRLLLQNNWAQLPC